MIYIVLGFLGLCLGSFINALVWRTYQQSIVKSKNKLQKLSISRGRSMCTSCGHELAVKDLIPVVSWITLGGKCRYCKDRVSPQYPLVELATSFAFVFSYAAWPAYIAGVIWFQFACWLVFITILIALAVYDYKYMLLPNKLVLAASIPVIAWILIETISGQLGVKPILDSMYGLLAFGGFFYVLYSVSKGKWIGGGDVKLGYVLGAWLASPLLSVLAIFVASLIGTAIVIAMSVRKKVTRNTKLPFGPLLIAGSIIAFLFGEQLLTSYSALFMGI